MAKSSKSKVIEIGTHEGSRYAVQFTQRARGEETPYWVGLVLRDGVPFGTFENNGRGGMTCIHPRKAVEAFRALVDAACPSHGISFERESLVLTWAETVGYVRGGAKVTLCDVVKTLANVLDRDRAGVEGEVAQVAQVVEGSAL